MNSSRLPLFLRSVIGLGAGLCAGAILAQDEEPPTISFPTPDADSADVAAPAPAPVTVELTTADFMRGPLLLRPDINGSGTHVGALFSSGSELYQLVVRDLATKEDIFLGGGESAIVDEFQWLDDTHIAYNLLGLNGADLGLMVTDITNPEKTYPIYQYGPARIIAVQPEKPLTPLVWVSVGTSEGKPAVVELDAATDRGGFVDIRGENEEAGLIEVTSRHSEAIQSVVPQPEGDQLGYLPDGKGSIGYAYTVVNEKVVMNVWDGKEWFLSPLDFSRADVVDVGGEPGQIIMNIPGPTGQPSTLRFVSAVSGELGDILLQDAGYDFNGSVFRDPTSRAIVGAFYDRNGPTSTWFDESYREVQKALNGYFAGRVVRLVDLSNDANVMLMAVTSDRDPVSYFTLNLAEKKLDVLQGERPWLPGRELSPTSIIKFTTADGKKLDAYVTLPEGTTKENPAPLIVLPHGGPWARSSWGFDPEAQLLAHHGFAVLQPNYRGSTGYDWMFTEAERGDMLMMHDDVTRSVRAVIKTGMIDADRIGISGGGFGGYLALTGLVEEPDLYAAGATVSGLFDWQRVANEIGMDREKSPVYGTLFELLGDPGSEAAKYDQISSGRRVNQIDDPILVVKERNGETLEAKEADELIEDLLSAGVVYEVHHLDGIGALESRVALFDRLIGFFKQNLK